MDFRTSARDKDLSLGFHQLSATDSAQIVQPLRRLTQATAETAYRTNPYAVTGWDQGGGDDYSDQATNHMRSSSPRYRAPERTAAPDDYGQPVRTAGAQGEPPAPAARSGGATPNTAGTVTAEGDPNLPAEILTPRERKLARAARRAGRGRAGTSPGPLLDPIDPAAPVGRTAGRGKATVAGRKFGPGRGALGGSLRRGRLAASATSAKSGSVPGASVVTRLIGLPTSPTQGATTLANLTTLIVQQGQRAAAALVAGLASTSGAALALSAGIILAILAVVVSFLPWLQWGHQQESGALVTGAIAPGTAGVPAEFIPLYNKAGATCPEMPATALAAQGHQESGFNPRAVSSAGAEGVAQFMPPTWTMYGKDANGDGKADPFDPADGIDAQSRYMCDLVSQMKQLKDRGTVQGDLQVLALSAYNAGPGAIATYGGVPPYPETQAYAPAILAYARTLGATLGGIEVTGDYAGVIKVLKSKLGTPYAYGGGGPTGPGVGWSGTLGWDCSSFMQYGFYQATNGKVALPRTAAAQAIAYSKYTVSRDALQPGDLIFWSDTSSLQDIGHVAIHVGGGQMIEEPHAGAVARLVPVRTDFMAAVRVPLS